MHIMFCYPESNSVGPDPAHVIYEFDFMIYPNFHLQKKYGSKSRLHKMILLQISITNK